MDYQSFNRVQMMGYVGKDPSFALVKNRKDTRLCSFPLATNEIYKGGAKRTFWWDCVGWQNMADWIKKYIKKGMYVFVEGSLSYYIRGHDEAKEKKIQVKVTNVIFLRKPKASAKEASGIKGEADEEIVEPEEASSEESTPVDFPGS